jgi:flagellar basal body-associated protein FliL
VTEPIEPQPESALEEPPKKSRSASLPIIILALVAIAGGTFWLYSRRHSAQAQPGPDASGDAPAPVKSVMHLESFTVNLADTEQTAFLRITIELGIGEAAPEGKSGEKNSPVLPKIRDVILTVLTTWQSEALLAPDGKAKLKQQLLSALQGQVQEVPVKEIYFTEFLVQR